jgi:oligopeptide/dipeptide ABC transporter ATP-binding protein
MRYTENNEIFIPLCFKKDLKERYMTLNDSPVLLEAPTHLSQDPLIEVQGLKKYFPVKDGFFNRNIAEVKALDGISFSVNHGETLGIVGESGCGKSTLARCLIRLEEPDKGQIFFDGQDWLGLSNQALRQKRANMQMIFQNPYASLNPRLTVGQAIGEPLEIFKRASKQALRNEVLALLDMVGLSASVVERYPSELSGGQRQRVCIARALALRPKLIIADEAVSALDVSVQAQVLNLMDDLKKELGLTYVFIAHNLSVVQHFCDRVAVMYLGKFMEVGSTETIFQRPQHPYTKALLDAMPIADPVLAKRQRAMRHPLVGELPSPMNPPSGCRFHTRCPETFTPCPLEEPELLAVNGEESHVLACHLGRVEHEEGDL